MRFHLLRGFIFARLPFLFRRPASSGTYAELGLFANLCHDPSLLIPRSRTDPLLNGHRHVGPIFRLITVIVASRYVRWLLPLVDSRLPDMSHLHLGEFVSTFAGRGVRKRGGKMEDGKEKVPKRPMYTTSFCRAKERLGIGNFL